MGQEPKVSVSARCAQQRRNGLLPAPLGMCQRRHAVMVRNVHIGASANQLAHDVLVRRATVRQDDGLQQRSPAQPLPSAPASR